MLKVAVLAFDRISPFHLSVPSVVFGDKHLGMPPFDFAVCAAEPGLLRTTAGFSVQASHGLESLVAADLVIVPSWRDPNELAPQAWLAALQAAHQRGAEVVGLCHGAYLLAQAGLLDGRQATTHWAYAEDFARRYPAVKVLPDQLYVEDGRLVTSAGTAAGLDCCLHLIRRRYGAACANRLARRLVTAPHRQGGQAQFIERPMPETSRDSRLAGALDWLRRHLGDALSLDQAAAQVAMSRRSFSRHFRQLTGMAFGEWLLAERLALVQRLLEGTALSIEAIAVQAGFGSPESLRLHFRTAFGVSPRAWRQTFCGG